MTGLRFCTYLALNVDQTGEPLLGSPQMESVEQFDREL
jgi:hypothetical protein